MTNIIIFFIISLSFFDNLWFVGSFDNTLVFFPLITINLWFVCFFDDSIRVRLVTLHYINKNAYPKHHGFIGVIDGTDLNGKHYNFFIISLCFLVVNLWFVGFFDDSIRVRLVTLHYIKQNAYPKHHGFIGVIDGMDLNGKHYNFFIISLGFLVVNLWFVGFAWFL